MAYVGKNLKINTTTFTPQSAQPANPVEGMVYYDDGTTNTEGIYKYQNAVWEFIGTLVDHLKLNPLAADPTTPVEGQLYYSDGTARAKGLWEYKDGDWQPVGSQGGSLNIIYQEDFETDMKAANLTSGNNATFDGGGTLDGALSDETVAPLNSRNSIKYVAGSSSANDYFHTGTYTLPKKARGNFISFSFHAKYSGAVDTIKAVLFDNTTSTIVESVSVNSAESKPYSLLYYVPASTTELKFGFQAQSGIASSDELIFDDFQVELNPFTDVIEGPVTNWEEYTPTIEGVGTPSAIQMFWRQNGENVDVLGTFTCGTNTANEFRFHLPNNFTVKSSIVTNLLSVGTFNREQSNADGYALATGGDNYLNVSSQTVSNLTPVNGNAFFTNNNRVSTQFSVPVNELVDIKGVLVKNSAAQNSEIRVNTTSGHGSPATMIRRFSVLEKQEGSEIEYTDSVADGASFKVKSDGLYTVTFTEFNTSGGEFGVTVNAAGSIDPNGSGADLRATPITSLTRPTIVMYDQLVGASSTSSASEQIQLKAGDVVRPHTRGFAGNFFGAGFTITKTGVTQLTGVPYTSDIFTLDDGITAPDTRVGFGQLYIDSADGDLKIKFGDGTVKTIVTDS